MKVNFCAPKTALLFLFIVLVFGTASAEEAQYAGLETCKGCHEDLATAFMKTLHGVAADPRTPSAKEGCESCHGAGSGHVNAGGGRGVAIRAFGKSSALNAEEKSAVCLDCHTKGKVKVWDGSSHEGRGLSCPDCHSIHGGNETNLIARDEPEVCGRCHHQVATQLNKTSRHPIKEGKITCSDCHNPHGTVTDKLISANNLNDKCYECHTEKRGPFLWEHAPATENCVVCHQPHGSTHDKLLVSKRPYLCQRCHSNSRHPGTLYGKLAGEEGLSVYQAENNRLFDSSCQNCHSQMQGSNHPSGKARLR